MHDANLNSVCITYFWKVWFTGFSSVKKSQKATRDLRLDHANAGEKQRADALLLARGLARSRERAQDLIADGAVLVNGVPIVKSSKLLATDCT